MRFSKGSRGLSRNGGNFRPRRYDPISFVCATMLHRNEMSGFWVAQRF
jgi:hypothetical protein